jgi:hypothetical protein
LVVRAPAPLRRFCWAPVLFFGCGICRLLCCASAIP